MKKFRIWDDYDKKYYYWSFNDREQPPYHPTSQSENDIEEYTGLEADKDIYVNDFISFKGSDDFGFTGSKVGKLFEEEFIDEVIVYVKMDDKFLWIRPDYYFKKNGKCISEYEWYSKDETAYPREKGDNNPFYEFSKDIHFLRYLLSKGGCKVIGNIKENENIAFELKILS